MSKRIVFAAPEKVELQDYEPKPVEAGEVMIENLYTVLSAGTERANITNMPNTVNKFPTVPGYCAVGIVTQLGEGVTRVKVGDRVIVYHGKHCTHTVMKAEKLVVVPDAVPSLDAVFTVIASMGLQGLRKCRPEMGESAAVIGLGLLGLFSIQCARLNGCYPVIAVDLNDERLALAKQLGADFAFRADDPDPVASVIFGVPTAGKLLLDFGKGGGTLDRGFRYYTDSALDGEYHVSTLSYLPSEGYAGQAIIPMTLVTRSGVTRAEERVVEVESKVSSEQFTDVVPETVGTWAANAVDFAYGRHLVSGVEDTLFAPNALMTRAQLVTVLYRAAGSPDAAVTTSFTDLEEGSYYYDAVVWANFHGIVNGTEPGTFSPNARLPASSWPPFSTDMPRPWGRTTMWRDPWMDLRIKDWWSLTRWRP